MRAQNYQELLDRLRLRQRAYAEVTFGPPEQKVIFGPPGTASYEFLTDLANFCRAFDHTPARRANGSIDTELELIRVGQRMVWDRIAQHLNLEPEQLALIYGAVVARQLEDVA
jgi:hypothetical protein